MKRLLANSELFHQMFDESPAFFALLRGPDFIFEMVNEAYKDLLPDRVIEGKPLREVIPEIKSQGHLDLLNHVYTTGELFKGHGMPMRLHDPDGNEREVYVDFVYQPIKDDEGSVIAIFIQGTDVTERKYAEEQLKQSEGKYRLLFQSIDQGYCVIKLRIEPDLPLDYQFVEINDAFEQQSGLRDAQGKWMRELEPQHEEFWFETYRDVALTGESVRFEHEAKELNRWFSVYAFRIGKPREQRVAVLFSDVTKRKKDEMALKTAHDELELKVLERTAELAQTNQELEEAKRIAEQASQAKSELLSNTSHELRTPLNSLLLISQLLAENPEKNLTPKQRKYVDVIYESGQDLLALVNDLLDMAQIEAGVSLAIQKNQISWPQLQESLSNNFAPIAAKKKLDFNIRLSPDLPQYFVSDERRLMQILKNLLANAFKFTRQGSVSLEINVAPADGARVAFVEDALQAIEFAVIDTGIGISPDKLQIIFEAFRQAETGNARQYGGTGLGLTISRALTQMLGGTITVESKPGSGSVFKVTLPSEPFVALTPTRQYGQNMVN
ncbi:MAG TPA: ATP-binding protein [Methylophilaceae bacterium]|nr:ATP-binding protein [Methylophilaceae bacterium]